MKTKIRQALEDTSVGEKVRRFYDAGSPDYLAVFGENIHDGYYITGRESREQAQENLIKLLVEKAQIRQGSRILDVGCGIRRQFGVAGQKSGGNHRGNYH